MARLADPGACGRAAAGAGEVPLRGPQLPRVGNLLSGAVAGGDRRQPDQAEVDPGGAGHRRQPGRGALDHEPGGEAAVGFAEDVTLDGTDGNPRDQRTRTWPTLATDSPVPWRAKPLPVRRIDWRPCWPGTEAANPAALAPARARVEPVAVGTPGVLAGRHQRDRGHLGQPRPFWPGLGQRDDARLRFGVAALLPGHRGAAPFGEASLEATRAHPNARASA